MKHDRETTRQLHKGEIFEQLTKHEGWGYAREMLFDKLLDYQSVRNIEADNPEQAMREIAIRREVCRIVLEWLQEIDAETDQHATNAYLVTEEDSPIRRYASPHEKGEEESSAS